MVTKPGGLTDHARYQAIRGAIGQLEGDGALGSWSGHGYRCVRVKYAMGDDLMSGAGSAQHGGRFTRPGGSATVYAATDVLLAVAETLANYARQQRQPWQVSPLVIVAVEARLERVLDLTTEVNRGFVGLRAEELANEDWQASNDSGGESLCQAVGRAAHDAGVEGLLVPSRLREGGANIVLFPDLVPAGRLVPLR